MINAFKDFWQRRLLADIDIEINDVISESLGVSVDVIKIVNELVAQIKDSIALGEFESISKKLDVDFIDDSADGSSLYNIKEILSVGGFVFNVDCYLLDYSNLSDDEFEKISTLNTIANVVFNSSMNFDLNLYIPTRKFEIGDIGIGVLNHEIMHAWQHYKKNDGKAEKKYPEWNRVYNTSIKILRSDERGDIYDIAKSIYYGDLKELASFTQQAYQELKDISDLKTVDKKIRETELYKGLLSIKDGLDLIKNGGLPDIFDINEKLLLKILNKRIEQYKKNISRVVIARKEIIEKDLYYFDIAKDELMLIRYL